MQISDFKIVVDSSADIKELSDIPFGVAPLKIITDNEEYIDDSDLDVTKMVKDLSEYTGKSSTACPSPIDWLKCFGGAKYIFCITITSGLSGSYNSAVIAKNDYEEQNKDKKVFVIDSLSTGPEMVLIAEKLREYIILGMDYETICSKIKEYQNNTALIFMLESMKNLANNGRVSKLAAKTAGLLGIRAVGIASQEGTLKLLEKSRGEKKAHSSIIEIIKNMRYKGGKIKIGYCVSSDGAERLGEKIKKELGIEPIIYPLGGLCSFYAEKGGLIIGFEK